MPFVNQPISFDQFMQQLRQRIEQGGNSGALIFFDCFLAEQLPREVREQVASDWDGQVNAGDFDAIYPMAADILHDAASRNFSEVHSDTYESSSAVSAAFCAELDQVFQCTGDDGFDYLPIKSYVQMMAEAGMVNLVTGPDGQTLVSFSEEGERVAQEFEEEIQRQRGQN